MDTSASGIQQILTTLESDAEELRRASTTEVDDSAHAAQYFVSDVVSMRKELIEVFEIINSTLQSNYETLRRLRELSRDSDGDVEEEIGGEATGFDELTTPTLPSFDIPGRNLFGSVTPRGDIRVAIREHFNMLLWKDAESRSYRVPWKTLSRNLLKTKRRLINWPDHIAINSEGALDVTLLKKSMGAESLLQVQIEEWTSREIRRHLKDNVPLIVSVRKVVLFSTSSIVHNG